MDISAFPNIVLRISVTACMITGSFSALSHPLISKVVGFASLAYAKSKKWGPVQLLQGKELSYGDGHSLES